MSKGNRFGEKGNRFGQKATNSAKGNRFGPQVQELFKVDPIV
jgi:hypothetical protein